MNPAPGPAVIPREHGAVAMLLSPYFAAVILLRRICWTELIALLAILCAFAIKDPLIALGRQRFVWIQLRAETKEARRTALICFCLLTASGVILVHERNWRPFLPLLLGGVSFMGLAVAVSIRNRQRSEWFQAASAIELSTSSFMACLAAKGSVPGWCWVLWLLSAIQAAAGIFVIHARLDARIAARKKQPPPPGNRRAAFVCQGVLLATAVFFAATGNVLIAAALMIAAAGYIFELVRQHRRDSLDLPLTMIGRQALALSLVYSSMMIAGLWRY